jgi:hypothetical protein
MPDKEMHQNRAKHECAQKHEETIFTVCLCGAGKYKYSKYFFQNYERYNNISEEN